MNHKNHNSLISIPRLALKVGILLVIINFGWILISNLHLGKLGIYNTFVDGRPRLPFGENSSISYNLSLYDIDAMLASHIVNAKDNKGEKNTRIFLIGDSSVWGFLQKPEQTISGLLTKSLSDKNQKVNIYNLGYPSISIIKDMMIIDKSVEYDPDLIIWFTTLEALPKTTQLEIPIVKNNPSEVNKILEKYEIYDFPKFDINPLTNTLWNQRRNISDILDLQIYGLLWGATGIDQEYPVTFQPAQRDFIEPTEEFHGISSKDNFKKYLALDVINNTIERNPEIDFIIINEPILISEGLNSSRQYNFYYPKWAYDQYRIIMDKFVMDNQLIYFDLWNIIPENEFTNSAIHLSQEGEKILADKIADIIDRYLDQKGDNE